MLAPTLIDEGVGEADNVDEESEEEVGYVELSSGWQILVFLKR